MTKTFQIKDNTKKQEASKQIKSGTNKQNFLALLSKFDKPKNTQTQEIKKPLPKQIQRDNDEETKRKKAQKLAKIAAEKVMGEIEDIGLDDEQSDKMEVEKKETKHHKKKGFRHKHGRYS